MKNYYLMVFADNSNMIFEDNCNFQKKNFMKKTRFFKINESITIKNLVIFQKTNYNISLCDKKFIEQIW